MRTGEKVGLILGVAIMGAGAVVTFVMGSGSGDEVVDTTTVVSTTVTVPTTSMATTTVPSSPTTTTTAAPTTTVDVVAVAREYMTLMANLDQAGTEAAAAASSGPASWYAMYLSHIALGDDWAIEESGGGFEMCLVDGSNCVFYDGFEVDDDGLLRSFAVDGIALEDRIWDPEQIAGVFCAADSVCDPDAPTPGDGSLWVVLRDAFITPYGALEVVLEVDTGDHPFRMVSRDGASIEATAFDSGGEEFEFDFCYIGLSDPDTLDWGGGRTGPQLPAGVHTHLGCDFYDIDAPAGDTEFTIEFTIEWGGGESPLGVHLPDLDG